MIIYVYALILLNIPNVIISTTPTNEFLRILMYECTLRVHLPGFGAAISSELDNTVNGNCTLTIQALKPTQKLFLHSRNITIDRYIVESGIRRYKIQQKNETEDFISFEIGNNLPTERPSSFKIYFRYPLKTVQSDDRFGFFNTGYDGALAFPSPTYAREIFPCEDRIDRKSIWKLTIYHPKEAKVISNSDISDSIPLPTYNYTKTIFDQTPPFAPYMLSIYVGSLFCEQIKSQGNIRVSACLPKPSEAVNLKEIAQEIAYYLDFYEHFFQVAYPLPKLDVLFNKLSVGGMESPGLITLDVQFVTKEGRKDLSLKLRHEIIHQWIGNIITVSSWNEVFIQEGIAEYLSRKEDFNSETVLNQFIRASLTSDSQLQYLLRTKLSTDAQVLDGAFQEATYYKSALIFRMVEKIIGEANFTRTLQELLDKYRFSTINNVEDLYQSFADKSENPENVRQLLLDFTSKKGHPIVRISVQNYTTVQASQYTCSQCSNWTIPLFYQYSDTKIVLLKWIKNGQSIHIPIKDNSNHPIIDPQAFGFYGLMHDDNSKKNLKKECAKKKTNILPLRCDESAIAN